MARQVGIRLTTTFLSLRTMLMVVAAFGLAAAGDSPAHAQSAAAPIPPTQPKPDADAAATKLPGAAGPSIFPARQRPAVANAPRLACSFWAPVCVHAEANVSDVSLEHVLHAAERFYRVTSALGLPQPLPDGRLGGDDRYDIYLLSEPAASITISDWMPAGRVWDQASAFTILPPPAAPFACDSDAAVARGLARAAMLRLDAGIEDAALAMAETHLADVVTDCASASIPAVDDFQRFPERRLGFRHADEAAGAFLFGRYLDDTYGIGVPGGVLASLLAVSAQRSPRDALHFANEPDLFDALRSNARARGKPIEDLLLEFAVNRAFVGSRSDDGHLVDVAKYGDAGRVRFEWNIPHGTLPRRLAPLRPIEPTGATYLWVDLQGAPEDIDLGFVADWEAGVLFHWAVVKVDAHGIEMGRITIAGIRGATHAERSIVGLRGVAGLIVVGVNVGSIDRSHPYDPDELEMARSYTVTLIR